MLSSLDLRALVLMVLRRVERPVVGVTLSLVLRLAVLELLTLPSRFFGEDRLGSVRFGEGRASVMGEEVGIGG